MREENVHLSNYEASSISLQYAQIAALRDFFASKNSHDLQLAYGQLMGANEVQTVDWYEVEYLFNRLFVGPMAVLAPPYASVYLDKERQVMGRVTLEVRDLYNELSLKVPFLEHNGVLPDDHIALELDALVVLLAVQEWCHSIHGFTVVEEECHMHLAWLAEHMAAWVPQFAVKVRSSSDQSTIFHGYQNIFTTTIDILSENIEILYRDYGDLQYTSEKILLMTKRSL